FAGGVREQTLAVLAAGGRHVSIADPSVEEAGGRWVWVRPDGPRLRALLERVAAGSLPVDIDRTLPLAEAASALGISKEGKASGKVLIDATRGPPGSCFGHGLAHRADLEGRALRIRDRRDRAEGGGRRPVQHRAAELLHPGDRGRARVHAQVDAPSGG